MNTEKTKQERKNTRKIWARLIDVFLRTVHVLFISIIFGGAVFNVSFEQVVTFYYFVLITGVVLVISEISHDTAWLYQGRGIIAIIHIAILGAVYLFPEKKLPLLAMVIIFGMAGSHMPKKLRYWSFFFGESKDDYNKTFK